MTVLFRCEVVLPAFEAFGNTLAAATVGLGLGQGQGGAGLSIGTDPTAPLEFAVSLPTGVRA